MRVTDRNDWEDLWNMDKKNIIATMYSNMSDDLKAGWNILSPAINRQKVDIANYENAYVDTLYKLATMTPEEANRWCFYDMKARGIIE